MPFAAFRSCGISAQNIIQLEQFLVYDFCIQIDRNVSRETIGI